MGLLIDHGHNQGRARGPAGPADALKIAGRSRRDGAQHGTGQIANINSHFQGAGTGQHIGIIGMLGLLETGFHPFAFFSGQQSRYAPQPPPAARPLYYTDLDSTFGGHQIPG